MGDLSPHFNRKELSCRCCGRLEYEPRLLDALEKLRELAGRPVIVTSGFRCPEHNRRVGGKPNSLHTRGLAADVRILGQSVRKMYELARQIETFDQGGIGVYPDEVFIHVDARPNPGRWARVNGHYVGLDAVGLA